MAGEDLNGYEDLKEHFSKFSLIAQDYNKIKAEKCNLRKSLDQVTSVSEDLRKSERNLAEQLRTLTQTNEKEESVNSLYFKLKDKYSDLEKKCVYFMQQNNSLQEKHLNEVTNLKEDFKRERNNLIQEFTQKFKYSEEQFLEERNSFLKRDNDLCNELQLVQATNALQYDEMQAAERTLRLQLTDVVDSHNALRQEHLSFKTRNQSRFDAAEKTINDLKCKLRSTEQQLHINQQHLYKLSTDIEVPRPVVHQVKSTVCPARYDALNVNTLDTSTNTNQGHSVHVQEPAMSCNAVKSTYQIKANVVSHLPPLRQLSKNIQKPKKRKLYTPGTVDPKDFPKVQQ